MIRLICYAHSAYTSACDGNKCAWRATPLSSEVSFLENPCMRIPAQTRLISPETRVPAEDLHRWQYVSIFITPPPVGTGSGVLFSLDFFLSFFVSLSARLRENGWTDLHEIFREGVEWVSDHGTTWFNFGSIRVNGSPQKPPKPQMAQNGDLDN